MDEDVAPPRTDGLADPDLARPFRHRYEHDVHDADAADEERDSHDCAHDQRRGIQRFRDQLQNLFLGQDAEVVLLLFLEMVTGAENFLGLILDEIEVAATAHLKGQDEALHVVRAPNR